MSTDDDSILVLVSPETLIEMKAEQMPVDPVPMLYLVVMEAVYDHGSGGIFTTREAAEAHVRALDADSDGHHGWRIDEIEADTPIFVEPRGEADQRLSYRRDLRLRQRSWVEVQAQPDPRGSW